MNRHDDLCRAMKTILTQTAPFHEVIVVDAGATSSLEAELSQICKDGGITFAYRHSEPSTTRQRNLGADLASGEILLFLDDDVELEQDYHENLLSVYEEYGVDEIGGAQGTQTNVRWKPPSSCRAAFERIFLLRRMVQRGETRIQASGNGVRVVQPSEIISVEYLQGFNMSFPRTVFERYRFDEAMGGYALKEDIDLSYRVSRLYKLYQTPHAKLAHHRSPVARVNSRVRCMKEVVNNVYFFNKNMCGKINNRVLFLWSLFGFFLSTCISAVVGKNAGFVLGFFDGIRMVGVGHLFGIGNSRSLPLGGSRD